MGVFERRRRSGTVYYVSFVWNGHQVQERAGTDKRKHCSSNDGGSGRFETAPIAPTRGQAQRRSPTTSTAGFMLDAFAAFEQSPTTKRG